MKKIVVSIIFLFTINVIKTQNKFTLQQCIEYAHQNNINIKQNILSAEIQKQETLRNKSALIPSVNSTLNHNTNIYMINEQKSNSFSTQLNFINANWTVYDGFRNLETYKKSIINKEIADKNIDILKNDIALNITNSYLQVLFNKELVKVAENQLALSNKQKNVIDTRFQAGSVSEADKAQIEALISQDELTLTQRKNNVLSSLLSLKNLLQFSLNESFDVKDIPVEDYIKQDKLSLMNSEMIYQKAITYRPEIQKANLNIQSSEKDLKIAKSLILPNITLGYALGTNHAKINDVNNQGFTDQFKNNFGNFLSVGINFPIFNGYKNKSQIEIAKINQENSQLTLENEKFNLRRLIEIAYLDANNAKTTYQSSLKNLTSRETSLKFTQLKFEIGSVNSFEFETAKNNWISALGSLIQAKYDYLFKVEILEFYQTGKFNRKL